MAALPAKALWALPPLHAMCSLLWAKLPSFWVYEFLSMLLGVFISVALHAAAAAPAVIENKSLGWAASPEACSSYFPL
ncbi:hypothetical protein [Desulfosporosinus nitroreducens]|uniref:hypothetical protein n=1 Tax=Desulfosporosinus nitroreducens TaxID=2018668 RepID=UPI00207C210C|nr:hypothetical protein [Desulfosporosinus nitroreducens]MCO1603925.1 hypothetical protein [Desulfosporosinus nitroreducens]